MGGVAANSCPTGMREPAAAVAGRCAQISVRHVVGRLSVSTGEMTFACSGIFFSQSAYRARQCAEVHGGSGERSRLISWCTSPIIDQLCRSKDATAAPREKGFGFQHNPQSCAMY